MREIVRAESTVPFTPRIGRREFARLSLTMAAAIASGCAAKPEAGTELPPITSTTAHILDASVASFVGDYSTGDFSQWWVQCKDYNGEGSSFPGSYSARIVADPSYGNAARFEVRTGDVAPFGGGERSEVSGGDSSGGVEGQVRWYRFATKFDPTFPSDHASLGWGLTNQWHGDSSAGTPPLNWSVSEQNGQWTLLADRQSSPGAYLGKVALFSTPLDVGSWHDVKMQVCWSTSDSAGFVELWHNGVRQTFTDGSQTYHLRTLVPSSAVPSVYYKEGYYRENGIAPTGIVYHAAFRCAATEAAL
ncbi:polysaccharide lyase [Mycobacterium sp.]|uniref:polysaccharide lyase n=1 Tax=Mycobacterium sp. TaxID=1785 RepID=UPI002CDD33FE|nr:polysaccharide lyase [Mycobacterium sp.]HKP43751.1 polysaccharide lyase [Mycobacterium sp.]